MQIIQLLLLILLLIIPGDNAKKPLTQKATGYHKQPVEKNIHENVLQDRVDKALQQLARSPSFNEFYLQDLLRLLAQEITIIDQVVQGLGGADLQESIEQRNKQLIETSPAIVYTYEKIIEVASDHLGGGKKLDKKNFLLRMKKKLLYYYHVIKDMQYDFILRSKSS